MKAFWVWWVCILVMVNANNLSKPTSQNKASENDSNEDEDDVTNLSDEQAFSLCHGERDSSSNSLESERSNLGSGNNFEGSVLPNLYHDVNIEGRSAYIRVYVGKNFSGADIYVSSPTLKLATSLAEKVRIGNGGIKNLGNCTNLQIDGSCGSNQFHKRPTKRKRISSDITSERKTLSPVDSTANDVDGSSTTENTSEYAVFEEGGSDSISECEIVPDSTSDPMKFLYDYLDSTNARRELVNSPHTPLETPSSFENISISKEPQTSNQSSSINFECPQYSEQSTSSDAPATERVGPENSANKPNFPTDSSGQFFRWHSIEECTTRMLTLDLFRTEFNAYDSLANFVVAVDALQSLVVNLDEYFGSARRLRSSLRELPQESLDLVDDISSNLRLMTSVNNLEAQVLFGGDSQMTLCTIFTSVLDLENLVRESISNFNTCGNEEEQCRIVDYLLSVLRELRNKVNALVVSAQPALDYFQTLQDRKKS